MKKVENTLKDCKQTCERLNIHYVILEIDLTVARTMKDEEIAPWIISDYNELKILYASDEFTIRLNEKTNDGIIIRAGDLTQILNFHIKQIYIQNEAGTGNSYLWLASRWD